MTLKLGVAEKLEKFHDALNVPDPGEGNLKFTLFHVLQTTEICDCAHLSVNYSVGAESNPRATVRYLFTRSRFFYVLLFLRATQGEEVLLLRFF